MSVNSREKDAILSKVIKKGVLMAFQRLEITKKVDVDRFLDSKRCVRRRRGTDREESQFPRRPGRSKLPFPS